MRRTSILVCTPLLALLAVVGACSTTNTDDGTDAGLTTTNPDGSVAADSASVDSSSTADSGDTTDAGDESDADDADADGGATATFRISGKATYDYVNANDDVTENGPLLDYANKTARAIRRATVFGMNGTTVVAQTTTNDLGEFDLDVPIGSAVTLRVAAQSVVTANKADATAPNHCVGASWDVKVLDNTQTDAQYAIDDTTTHAVAASGITLNAPLVFDTTTMKYTKRTAAPFAILDTIVTEIELVCQGQADVTLPSLHVQWSVNNVPTGDDVTTGMIGTSHYTRDPVTMQSDLRILGQEDVDTDEYDDHVIAHEFGHYLEDRLFRSDSVGGTHGVMEDLDPRVAFGEGWGNALSAMTFNDPIYVDTSGAGQQGGSTIVMTAKPTGDDRGIYSETSVQYMLWKLFDNRSPGNGSIDRIFNIFLNHQKTTPGLTSLMTFSAYYNQVYGGAAEGLKTLWQTDLDTPFDALCVGTCTGTGDTADVFDTNNDIGSFYSSNRSYPQGGAVFDNDFWRQSALLVDGNNAATSHDQTNFGGYASSDNKLGAQRAYRYVSTVNAPVTMTVSNLGASACTNDVLDMIVTLNGQKVTFDQETTGATAGCPTVTFNTDAGKTYTIVVNGTTTAIPSYDITVARKPGAPFTVTSALSNRIAEGSDVTLPILVTPTRNATDMTVSIRGLDGAVVRNAGLQNRFLTRVSGAAIAAPAVTRIPHGGAGFVVVDVAATVDGRRVRASYPVAVRGATAAFAQRTLGSLTTATSGVRFEAMPAVVR